MHAFVKSDRPRKFPGLEIFYKRGQDPIIKLMDDAGHVEETLSIDKWNTDSLEEFLTEALQQDPS
ncbi:unnamed protein product [Darwinula stevensoni]|uniref:Selenoprotein F n=1 Tax=Darwinula stevensoni TaxID=69355 RepID=A0A7R8X924_9CRUS|nr:unnamed protein product [Darwinula stevensoni]CAG0890224.1 unnamed protein product [Darwinula stevensoni]